MIDLIRTMRHSESMQRVVQGYDDMIGTAIRKLGDSDPTEPLCQGTRCSTPFRSPRPACRRSKSMSTPSPTTWRTSTRQVSRRPGSRSSISSPRAVRGGAACRSSTRRIDAGHAAHRRRRQHRQRRHAVRPRRHAQDRLGHGRRDLRRWFLRGVDAGRFTRLCHAAASSRSPRTGAYDAGWPALKPGITVPDDMQTLTIGGDGKVIGGERSAADTRRTRPTADGPLREPGRR